jgi:hypothetical protein
MNRDRSEMMEKARARRPRRHKNQSASPASHERKSPATDVAISLTEKVLGVAQDAAAQVGSFVKSAAATVSGARDDKLVNGPGSDSRGANLQ